MTVIKKNYLFFVLFFLFCLSFSMISFVNFSQPDVESNNKITADKIISKYFENTGGLENWKQLKSIRTRSKVIKDSMEISMNTLKKYPNKIKTIAEVRGFKTETICNSEGTYMIVQNQVVPLLSATENKNNYDDLFSVNGLFINYKENDYQFELEGKELIEGVECFKIKHDMDNVIKYYFFDTINYFLILEKSKTDKGSSETYYSSYRKVGNLLIPYTEIMKSDGKVLGSREISEIEINPEIDDTEFEVNN